MIISKRFVFHLWRDRSPWKTVFQVMALLILSAVATLMLSCAEESVSSIGSGTGKYNLETEPALSLDHQFVYFVTTDTSNVDNSGIYRARVSKPIRELIHASEGLHSPTIAPDNNRLGYLDSGLIRYYDLSQQLISSSSIDREFHSIQFVNDSLLVAYSGDSIYLVNESRVAVSSVAAGWDPSPVARDTFIYVVPIVGYAYGIVRFDISSSIRDTIFYISVFGNFGNTRWPSWDPTSDRLAWVHDNSRTMQVHVGAIEPYLDREIDSTGHERTLMLHGDLVIFSGPDGRLYQSNFAGSDIAPWWHAEN